MRSAKDTAENYVLTGDSKTRLPLFKMFVLAILAGFFIAAGGILSTVASCTVESQSIAKLISGCVFPAGLTMVVIAGSELFTGDCLAIIPVLSGKTKLSGLVKLLVVVYIGNFVGSIITAALVVYGHTPSMFGGAVAEALVSTAVSKVSLSFGDAFIRGFLCNVLVCLAVWMTFFAENPQGKLLALFFPIMAFVVCGFEHSVANMFYIPAGLFASWEYGIAADGLNFGTMVVKNLIPVTLGNLAGGAGLGVVIWGLYLKKKK